MGSVSVFEPAPFDTSSAKARIRPAGLFDIMGQGVGHLPHPDDQRLSSIEHFVERPRQSVQLITS